MGASRDPEILPAQEGGMFGLLGKRGTKPNKKVNQLGQMFVEASIDPSVIDDFLGNYGGTLGRRVLPERDL